MIQYVFQGSEYVVLEDKKPIGTIFKEDGLWYFKSLKNKLEMRSEGFVRLHELKLSLES